MRFHQYVYKYQKFVAQNEIGKSYLVTADTTIVVSKNVQVLKYVSDNTKNIFVIIPSIFNSPEILFIHPHQSFVKRLQSRGEIYLLNWLEGEDKSYSFNDYVLDAAAAIEKIAKKTNVKINLIGHCIGGNIAVAVSILQEKLIHSLTLLTTPWDFCHFYCRLKLYDYFDLNKKINDLDQMPKSFIQILFFLLFPNDFNLKLDKFFQMSFMKQQLFFRVQEWLLSGNNLSKLAYFQLLEELIITNGFLQNKWQINDQVINPQNLRFPCVLVVAKTDKLVPYSSILPLYRVLKNVKLIELKGGHINYLIGKELDEFAKHYHSWLSTL